MTESGRALEIERLDWDTAFFGRSIGRLLGGDSGLIDPSAAERLDRSAFDCVYVELDAGALRDVGRWIAMGARPIDVRVELDASTDRISAANPVNSVEPIYVWRPRDERAARHLAASLSRWSRFALDPGFAPSAGALYDRWIELVFSGSHEALAWRDAGEIAGLLTFRLASEAAWIELLVVDEARQGRGIASTLIAAFLSLARERGHDLARVKTQLRNTAALRSYERAGFAIRRATLVLHWWRS